MALPSSLANKLGAEEYQQLKECCEKVEKMDKYLKDVAQWNQLVWNQIWGGGGGTPPPPPHWP
jgi:hypothetical protein